MTPQRRAFTLIEMLIALGLIFLLASLVIVALSGVRSAANRADSVNALRQILQGYSGYTADNKSRFMPGNVDAAMVNQLGIAPKLVSGQTVTDEDAGSYVWRLAPYLDNSWQTLFIDYRNDELIARLNLEYDGGERTDASGSLCGGGLSVFGAGTAASAGCDDIAIARSPSFGLNSIFVGGDNVNGDDNITDRNPWDDPNGKLAATRFSEVKNAARLIVFGPTAFGALPPGFPATPPISDLQFGSPELRPPFLSWSRNAQDVLVPDDDTLQWIVGADNKIELDPAADFSEGGGIPIARWGEIEVPVAHLDGSVLTKELLDLGSDLRSWSPFVVGY